MSSDKLIYLVSAEATESKSLKGYFDKHQFNSRMFTGLEAAVDGIDSEAPHLIVLAGSKIPSPDICKFGASVEQRCDAPIIALLTQLQMSIVSEMAESENLWTAEYPISLREIRASVTEAIQELDAN